MKNQKFACVLLASLIASPSYASYPQNVQICLSVTGNTSPNTFTAGFKSSDIFDGGNYVNSIFNGENCVTHTYRRGPKDLRFEVKMERIFRDGSSLITIDNSCSFLRNVESDELISDFQGTGNSNESWNFSIVQEPMVNGFKYNYVLKCQHFAN